MKIYLVKNLCWAILCFIFLNCNNTTFAQITDNQHNTNYNLALHKPSLPSSNAHNLDEPNPIPLSPNAAQYDVSLDFGKEEQNATARLYADDGRLLRQYSAIYGRFFKLSLREFPAGTYFLQVNDKATFAVAK